MRLLVLVLAGCIDHDGVNVDLEITSPEPFDRLELVFGRVQDGYCAQQWGVTAPLTPELLLAGAPAPTGAEMWDSTWSGPGRLTTPTRSYHFEENADEFGQVVAAVATKGDAVVASAMTAFPNHAGDDIDRTIALSADTTIELFGGAPCVRTVDDGGVTRYFISDLDCDCDGIDDRDDCKPGVYCDPDAPSGPTHDACQCPTAQ